MMIWLACSFFVNKEDHSSLNESWIEIFNFLSICYTFRETKFFFKKYITFPSKSTRKTRQIKI